MAVQKVGEAPRRQWMLGSPCVRAGKKAAALKATLRAGETSPKVVNA